MANIDDAYRLRAALDDLTQERPPNSTDDTRETAGVAVEPPPPARFSPFDPGQMARATALMSKLEGLVGRHTRDGHVDGPALAADIREVAATERDRGAMRHAILLLRTHHPDIKALGVARPLEERAPWRVLSSRLGDEHLEAADPEQAVAWFRDDPGLNEHHEQWHLVYPNGGLPPSAPGGEPRFQDRQGEVFVYMHQQMLARYDVERLGAGLEPVAPFGQYDQPIAQGYDPTSLEGLPDRWKGFSGKREPSVKLPEYPESSVFVRGLQRARTTVDQIVQTAAAQGFPPITVDALGAILESSDPSKGPSANLHNLGHIAIAVAVDPKKALPPDFADWPLDQVGVMADTDTALRDPVFWRWHRHIDDFAFRFQEDHLDAYRVDDAAPPGIELRAGTPGASPDVFVVRSADLPPGLRLTKPVGAARWFSTRLAEIRSWATEQFGGANFDRDPATLGASDELRTFMRTREVFFDPSWAGQGDVNSATITTLDHEDFLVGVRVENRGNSPVELVLRLFLGLADQPHRENRRLWIELDKFLHTAPPGRSVAIQPATMSSVVRKPARRLGLDGIVGEQEDDLDGDGEAIDLSYCNCGLPYTLLLPRGAPRGTPFALYVIATSAADDLVRTSRCGSLSFCGSRDRYPDKREMGFPFNRKVDNWATVLNGFNRTWRTVRIVNEPHSR